MEQRKKFFFADFGWHFFCVFVKISKKLGVMEKLVLFELVCKKSLMPIEKTT
jgi:hypothetical protein